MKELVLEDARRSDRRIVVMLFVLVFVLVFDK